MMNVTSLAPGMQTVTLRGDVAAKNNVSATSSSSAASIENAEASSATPTRPRKRNLSPRFLAAFICPTGTRPHTSLMRS